MWRAMCSALAGTYAFPHGLWGSSLKTKAKVVTLEPCCSDLLVHVPPCPGNKNLPIWQAHPSTHTHTHTQGHTAAPQDTHTPALYACEPHSPCPRRHTETHKDTTGHTHLRSLHVDPSHHAQENIQKSRTTPQDTHTCALCM